METEYIMRKNDIYWIIIDVCTLVCRWIALSNSNSKTQSGKLKFQRLSFRFTILQETLWG